MAVVVMIRLIHPSKLPSRSHQEGKAVFGTCYCVFGLVFVFFVSCTIRRRKYPKLIGKGWYKKNAQIESPIGAPPAASNLLLTHQEGRQTESFKQPAVVDQEGIDASNLVLFDRKDLHRNGTVDPILAKFVGGKGRAAIGPGTAG